MEIKKRVFYNRFNRAADKERKLSNVDCVDRLSYVDNTKLVKRFIAEGRNLAMFRAQSLYKDYEDAASSSDAALPVFKEDIVFTTARIDSLTDEINKRNAERSKASAVNPSVTKENDTSGNSNNSEGPAVV